MACLKKWIESHPGLQEALEHVGDIAPFAEAVAEATTQTMPQPYLGYSMYTKLSEEQARKRLAAFEKAHPEITQLSELVDEYQHLKAELAMAQLGKGAL